ncbi:flavodoxin family protein [Streptomyces noursei]|uniref:flavodoxin family protein n=1 Tax=Streptomyces noursei TaxID=1971 RepID=UPI0035E21694
MQRAPHVAVIYHSRKGTLHALARAAADGALAGGATVRLRRVEDRALKGPPPGAPHPVPVATHDDVLWADGVVLGTPTYFGNVSAALKQFLESTSDLWRAGALADRVVTGMTSANSPHGGREATLLALYRSMYHWGTLIMSADPTDSSFTAAGANPYGVGAPPATDGALPDTYLRAAGALGRRIGHYAHQLAASRASRAARSTTRPTRIAVLHHPDCASTRILADALAHGARSAQAEVRLRPLAPPGTAHTPTGARAATPADVAWADAVAFGAPVRAGLVAPLLSQFLAACEPLCTTGELAAKTVTAFVTTSHPHSGSETALLALYDVLHHWGAVLVPPGYTDPAVAAAGGNPYGTAHSTAGGSRPADATVKAAAFQGQRLARLTARLRGRCATSPGPPREPPPADRAGPQPPRPPVLSLSERNST